MDESQPKTIKLSVRILSSQHAPSVEGEIVLTRMIDIFSIC